MERGPERASTVPPGQQDGALVFGGRAHPGDAVHEVDLHLAILEAAGHGIVVRGFVVAPGHFKGVVIFPTAAGGEPGRGRRLGFVQLR